MKRVLILTYYWPPSGGSGVQRWLKMSKYLPENGWQPVVYTAKDAEYPVEDLSLEKDVLPEAEVIRRPIFEPYSFYKKFLGIKKSEKVKAGFINEGQQKKGWKEDLSIWIRGNLFIPDARCLWIRPSVRFLKKYLKSHPVNVIISTGPPHSMHLIAMRLKKHFDIPWVADFRDPWTDIYYYEDLKLGRFAHRKQCRLEHEVLQKADKVVTVSRHCALGLERHGTKDIKVIPNGYDGDCNRSNLQANGFILSHIGIIPPKTSPVIWEAIGELIKEHKEFSEHFQLRLVGQIDNRIKELLIKYGVSAHTEFVHYLPHEKMPENQGQSHVLLLLIPHIADARGIVTGKFYEYLQARRPILGIGPENGDAATILKATQSGLMIDFTDKSKMKAYLLDLFSQYQQHQLSVLPAVGIENYSRKVLAGEYVKLLDKITQR